MTFPKKEVPGMVLGKGEQWNYLEHSLLYTIYKVGIMRVTKKKAEEIITEAVGADALEIVEFLKAKKNISEFVISEKTKTEIHVVRNVLYRLHNYNLAQYKRKKDSKKGYYISYWTYHPKVLKDVGQKLNKNKLYRLRERLTREENNTGGFFMCGGACIRLDFEQGTEHEFRCPECGEIMNQQDNVRTIEFLRKQIQKLEVKV
jgi:transcription initiation factor TFIIE subunit alpha